MAHLWRPTLEGRPCARSARTRIWTNQNLIARVLWTSLGPVSGQNDLSALVLACLRAFHGRFGGSKRRHIAYFRGQFADLDDGRNLLEAPGRDFGEKEQGPPPPRAAFE